MPRQFPYFAATTVTLAAGAITSLVRAAVPAVAHPVAPVSHPVTPIGVHLAGPPVVPPRAALPPNAAFGGNAVNTPTSTGPPFLPYSPNLAVGPNAAPALTRAATYGQAGMNQAGQPPYEETFVSNQTAMNQPGQADFYEGMPNPNVLQANEGIQPSNAYPNPVTPQTGVPSTATTAAGFGITQGPNTVGFYNGFGPGQPNWGFFAGFTTPR